MFTNNQAFSFGMQSSNQPQLNLFGNNNNFNSSLFNQGLQTPQKTGGLNSQNNSLQNIPLANGTFNYKFEPVIINDNKERLNMMNICAHTSFQQFSVEELKLMDRELKKKGMVYNPNIQTNSLGFNNNNTNGNQNNLFAKQNTLSTTNTLFGQQQASTVFGTQGTSTFTNNSNQSNGLFANQGTNNSYGQLNNNGNSLFGTTPQANGIFGTNNSVPPGLLGTQALNQGLVGNQMNQNQSSSLFANSTNNTGNTNLFPNNGGSSLFGNTNNNMSQSSLFGSSQPQANNNNSFSLFNNSNNSSNIFSAQNKQQQSLFNNLQGPTVSLLNNPQQQSSTTSSLFGSIQPSNTNSLFLTSSSLFDSKLQPTGSLFGLSGGNNNSLFSSTLTSKTASNLNNSLNTSNVTSNQYYPQMVQQYWAEIDMNELPQEIVDALQEQKDINQIKKDLEDKYDKEIKGSLLYNQLTTLDRKYQQDYFSHDGIDFSKEYFKSKYLYNSSLKKEIKITIKPKKYATKVNNPKVALSTRLLSSFNSVKDNEEHLKKDQSKSMQLTTPRLVLIINTKQYFLSIPDCSSSILSLKTLIQSDYLKNIPIDEFSLIYKNQFLLESNTLRDYNINEYSIIEVIKNNNTFITSPIKNSKSNQERVARVEDIPKISLSKYQITPEYKEICRMSSDELQHVSNFTISNEFGKIRFLTDVNLLGLNIDDIITIEHLKVMIYYFKSKPPKGEELNVPKEITINHLFISEKEEEELKISIMERNATFISHDKATGILVFREE